MRSESFPSLLPLNATLAQKSAAAASRDALCDEWVFAYAYASAFLYGAAFITIAINVVLNQLVFIGVAFEKHNNATSELRARALYLFVLQFINTGLLVLLLNAQISSPTFSLLRSGENPDFNVSWYTSVGTSIILTMLLNLFIPHIMPLALTLYSSLKRCCDRDCSDNRKKTNKYTQAELNELHLGPEMQIDERYAQLYNTPPFPKHNRYSLQVREQNFMHVAQLQLKLPACVSPRSKVYQQSEGCDTHRQLCTKVHFYKA
jgi:hypothetical protein